MEFIRYTDLSVEFLNEKELLIGHDITLSTFRGYKRKMLLFKSYLGSIDLDDIYIHEIRLGLLKKYDLWLRTTKKVGNNYIMKNIQFISMLCDFAIMKEYISENPCKLFKYRYNRELKRNYISYDDLKRIEEFIPDENESRLNRTRDLFVFAAYTGLSYIDLKKFDIEKHTYVKDNVEWIRMQRTKNGNESLLPLLPKAKNILLKYSNKLPVIANANYNKYLKLLSKRLNLKSDISTHSARKTFGMIMHNEFGVSIDSVAKMMGHTCITTTQQWYVNTAQGKIMHDMKSVINKMGESFKSPVQL